jgi:hypothetical protein
MFFIPLEIGNAYISWSVATGIELDNIQFHNRCFLLKRFRFNPALHEYFNISDNFEFNLKMLNQVISNGIHDLKFETGLTCLNFQVRPVSTCLYHTIFRRF